MVARIYSPAKTPTQSGQAKCSHWVLDFEPQSSRKADPLMGWTSSSDMSQQLKLIFATCEEAVEYAKRQGLAYRVLEAPAQPKRKIMSYSENFSFRRHAPWTH
jgi:ETC complex I subunit conserved region